MNNKAVKGGEQTIDIAHRLICKNCKKTPPNIVEDYKGGDMICGDCGLVFPGRIIDTHSEWRNFNDDNGNGGDDPSRIGQAENPLLEGVVDHLSTGISRVDGRSGMAASLSKTQGKVTGTIKGDKDMMDSFRQIQTFCDRIALPRLVVERSKQLYKKIWDAELLKKRPNNHLIAGCIFIACRQESVARTFAEISKLANIDLSHLKKAVNIILAFLKESHSGSLTSDQAQAHIAGASAEQLIPRLCSQLGLDAKFIQQAQETVRNIEASNLLTGRNPSTVAGSAMLLLLKLSGRQSMEKQVTQVVQLSDYTIRKALKLLDSSHKDLIPKSFTITTPLQQSNEKQEM